MSRRSFAALSTVAVCRRVYCPASMQQRKGMGSSSEGAMVSRLQRGSSSKRGSEGPEDLPPGNAHMHLLKSAPSTHMRRMTEITPHASAEQECKVISWAGLAGFDHVGFSIPAGCLPTRATVTTASCEPVATYNNRSIISLHHCAGYRNDGRPHAPAHAAYLLQACDGSVNIAVNIACAAAGELLTYYLTLAVPLAVLSRM
jgi:hypothetical protein